MINFLDKKKKRFLKGRHTVSVIKTTLNSDYTQLLIKLTEIRSRYVSVSVAAFAALF